MSISKKNFFHFFKPLIPFLVIIGLVFIFFWKVIIKGLVPVPADLLVGAYLPWSDYKWGYSTGVPVKNPIVSDAISFVYPMRTLGIDILKSKQVPLWNPYLFGGAPLLANFQSAPFSPTNILYFIFNENTAWGWQVIFQHVLAGFFTYLFLRSLKLGKAGSIFGSVAYTFSGFCLIWSQWNAHTLAASFIPLILYFENKWLTDKKYWAGVGLSFSICLQVFSGYPQIAIYTFLAMGALWLVKIYKEKDFIYRTLGLFVFSILGFGLSAPQILPASELVGLSQRNVEPIPLQWVFLRFREIILFLAPDYFGNHATANYWGYKNYLVTIVYVGIVPLTLTILGFLRTQNKIRTFFIILILGALILAFPNPLSLLLWNKNIFGLQAGVFYKSLILFTFSITCLSGFAVDYLMNNKKLSIKNYLMTLSFPWLIFLCYAVFTLYLYFSTKGILELSILRGIPKYFVALKNLIFPGFVLLMSTIILWVTGRYGKFKRLGLLAIFILLIFELFRFGWKFTPFVPSHIVYPTTPVWDFLLKEKERGVPFRVSGGEVTSVNLNVPYGIEFLGGYDAVYPLVSAKFAAVVNSNDANASPQDRFGIISRPTSHLTNLMNMKYLFIKTGGLYDQKRFKPVFSDQNVTILENKNVLPRAFMVCDWETETREQTILTALLKQDFPLDKKIYIEETVPFEVDKGACLGQVVNIGYKENQSIYEVESEKDGLLFVSDTFYPGWKVYVDGEEKRIYRADTAFRAVPITRGRHIVKFVYQPDSFSRGLKLAGISLGFLILMYPICKLVARRKPRYT